MVLLNYSASISWKKSSSKRWTWGYHKPKNSLKRVLLMNLMVDAICDVAANKKSSDTVSFIRLHSNPEEATDYITGDITDDYGHNIAPEQPYIRSSYYEMRKTTRNSQVYLLINKVAYLYKDSIMYPHFNTVECPNNYIEIQNQDLCDIITYIEHFDLIGL